MSPAGYHPRDDFGEHLLDLRNAPAELIKAIDDAIYWSSDLIWNYPDWAICYDASEYAKLSSAGFNARPGWLSIGDMDDAAPSVRWWQDFTDHLAERGQAVAAGRVNALLSSLLGCQVGQGDES